MGVGDRGGGGRLNKDAQEVILQGYIQGSSINGCLKMAVGWWGRRGGGSVGVVDFWYSRWHAWWFRAAGRASST